MDNKVGGPRGEKNMKKLLGLLTVAPLALTACGDKTSAGGDGGSQTATEIQNFLNEGTMTVGAINEWFTDGHANNLKTKLAAAAANSGSDVMNAVVGGSFVKKSQKSYSFTAPGRSAFTGDLNAAVTEFKAGLATINAANSVSTPSSIQAPWDTVLKSGQIRNNYGTSDMKVAEADLSVIPTSVDANTTIDLPKVDLLVTQMLIPLGSNVTPSTPTDISITAIGQTTITGDNLLLNHPTYANVDLGRYVDLPATLPWVKGSASTATSAGDAVPYVDGSASKKLYVHGTPNTDVTHSTPFISYYFEDFTDFSGTDSLGAAAATNPLDMKVAIFRADGALLQNLYDIKIPKFNGTVNADKEAYNKALLNAINLSNVWTTPGNDTDYALKTAGSVEVESDRRKALAIKTSDTHWTVALNGLTGHMDGFASFGSEIALKEAVQYFAKESLVGFSETGNDLYSMKFSDQDVDYPGREWVSIEEIYKKACDRAKSDVERIEPGAFTGNCPA